MPHFLPRTVIILGLVSFLNDTASEMITPLLPLFLTATLGAGPAIVGLVEGIAEATASILKLLSGWLVDRGWSAKKMVVSGYTVSNAARPLIGLAFGWGWVLLLRFLDRVGKGIRTAPRDTLIASTTDQQIRGRAFGFQRSLDHAGGMLGPLLAFGLLQWGMSMEHVFMAAIIPGGLLILLLIFGLKIPAKVKPEHPPAKLYWKGLDFRVKGLVLASGGLALAATPEAFLILWASHGGLELVWVPLLWAAASGIKALVAGPAGALSDRYGRLQVVSIGWTARILLLIAFASVPNSGSTIWVLFLGYAASLAFSEGAERALLGDFAPADQQGTVFGLYHLLNGLMALPGAVLFGVVWQWVGMSSAFIMAAILTAVSAFTLRLLVSRKTV
ncbi:MAG: MFS transporter [Gammaproteobacteria bacterium]|nr:MAG: MFS transporter [Gammaproteobacteria bacterium]